MHKSVWLSVKVLVVLAVVGFLWVDGWFSRASIGVNKYFHSITQISETKKLKQLRDSYFKDNLALQTYQVDYVLEVTASVQTLSDFEVSFCRDKQINPIIYGNQLNFLCRLIKESELLNEQ